MEKEKKMKMRCCKYTCCQAVIVSFVGALFMTYFIKLHQHKTPDAPKTIHVDGGDNAIITSNVFSNMRLREQMLRRKAAKLKASVSAPRRVTASPRHEAAPNRNVHIFYYAWHGDGGNASLLLDANATQPNVASNFYPQLGPYTCADNATLDVHMRQLRAAGVGVLALSWTPPNYPASPDALVGAIFERAARHALRVALHVEPYAARQPANLRAYLADFLARFGAHPALYKTTNDLPMFYVRDSHLIPDYAWRDLLAPHGALSVRGTALDGVFLGQLADVAHRAHVRRARFDGFYTYHAANGYTYGSTWKHWRGLARYARQNALLFSASVGPGYADTRVRPWNAPNARQRHHGRYYDVAWRTALAAGAHYVSVTSFNQWRDGTQIEPALNAPPSRAYADYSPEGPTFYLNLTQFWVEQYEKALGPSN